jgi:transposase
VAQGGGCHDHRPHGIDGRVLIPVFEILEARGFEVLLVNARDVKNVPGRKTDVNDAQWLQQLHEHGLLRGSIRPHERIVRLRALPRHRERLIDQAASHIQHMQKALACAAGLPILSGGGKPR